MDTAFDSATLKRKRDDALAPPTATDSSAAPVSKATKITGSNQMSINYLARQSQDDLPLVNKDDTLPNLLSLLATYGSIMDRHESLASNLGARPLGPILIKRFERCFDSPPRVVASHHKGAATSPDETTQRITWLEVIEFARSHPTQFSLSSFSEGKRVCQFYYPQKQLRVQISEEDFLFINSGRCQELIPPLPIWEDEEKEVATCDVLEAKLKELTTAADMVAARTRQLSHRLKHRRGAILERRAEGGSGTPAKASAIQTTTAPPSASGVGFTAVNTGGGRVGGDRIEPPLGSSTVRNDLLRHLEGLPQNQAQARGHVRHPSISVPDPQSRSAEQEFGRAASTTSSLSPVPQSAFTNDFSTPHTSTEQSFQQTRPVSNCGVAQIGGQSSGGTSSGNGSGGSGGMKHNFSRPLPAALESSQPYRPLCQAHMDSLGRGHRVLPPCDRCRRLRMDCVKNLTSCAGCTKKHARCHWRDVSREELGALDNLMDAQYTLSISGGQQSNGHANGNDEVSYLGTHRDVVSDEDEDDEEDDDSNPLEDLEALGEKEEREVAERLREDVEGLQGAKELSRNGWDEGVRPVHHSSAGADSGISGSAPGGDDREPKSLDSNGAGGRAQTQIATTLNGGEVSKPISSPSQIEEERISMTAEDDAEQSIPSTAAPAYMRFPNLQSHISSFSASINTASATHNLTNGITLNGSSEDSVPFELPRLQNYSPRQEHHRNSTNEDRSGSASGFRPVNHDPITTTPSNSTNEHPKNDTNGGAASGANGSINGASRDDYRYHDHNRNDNDNNMRNGPISAAASAMSDPTATTTTTTATAASKWQTV